MKSYVPLLTDALKAPYCRAFRPLIVHAPPCAAVRCRLSADGEQRRRSQNSISLGWSVAGTAPRSGSSVYCPFCRAVLFPVPGPVAGPRLGNICRSATGKCSGRRRKAPSHRPAAGSSHLYYCSTDAPAAGQCGIAGRSNAVSYFPIRFPFVDFEHEKGRSA